MRREKAPLPDEKSKGTPSGKNWRRLANIRAESSALFTDCRAMQNTLSMPGNQTETPAAFAIVDTGHFRCLGFKDMEGSWRDAYRPNDPPLSVVGVELIEFGMM